jgi:hypothetical protein
VPTGGRSSSPSDAALTGYSYLAPLCRRPFAPFLLPLRHLWDAQPSEAS